jgi:hypothetical protein
VSPPITLDLTRVEELFQAPAANPFSTREIELLGESGMDFLRKRYTRRWPRRRDALAVLIRLPSELHSGALQAGDRSKIDQLTQDTRAAIRRYCDLRVQTNRQARRLAMDTARRELLIALVVTVIAIVMVAWYAASEPSGFAGYVLAIVTLFAVYAAALAIWDALESWFFDWTPFAVENMAYRWISSLEVHVALQTKLEAEQGTAANE